MSKNLIYAWNECISQIHQQFFHLENSAKIMGITKIGPVISNHISYATRRFTYHSFISTHIFYIFIAGSSNPDWAPRINKSESMSEEVQRDSSCCVNTETLPVLLMNYLQSREQVWYRVSIASLLSSPQDGNCDICLRTKITSASCKRRTGTVVPRAEKFGDLMTVDHEVLSEGCESRDNYAYAVMVQDLTTQWIQ